jgi:hypothetical protein
VNAAILRKTDRDRRDGRSGLVVIGATTPTFDGITIQLP